MKKFALIALTSVFTLCTVLPSQADSSYPVKNPRYPQDRSWDYADQGANAGGAGGD